MQIIHLVFNFFILDEKKKKIDIQIAIDFNV